MKKILIFFLLIFLINSINISSDDFKEFEFQKNALRKMNIIETQFIENPDTFIKLDAINAASEMKKYCYPFYKKIFDSNNNFFIKEILNIICIKKIKFQDLILKALEKKDNEIIIKSLQCWFLLDKKDQQFMIKKCFDLNNPVLLPHLLPLLFSNPKDYKNEIRKYLYNDNVKLRLTAYKYLVDAAPAFFELAIMGIYDEDVCINRFMLSNYKKYGERGMAMIYYSLRSDKKSIINYARLLLKNQKKGE